MLKKVLVITSAIIVSTISLFAQGPTGYTECGTDPTFTEPTNVAYGDDGIYIYLFNQIGPFTTSNRTFGRAGTGAFWRQTISTMDVATPAANLSASFTALQDHITATTTLTGAQILVHLETIKENISAIAVDSAVIAQAFDLVETFETTVGPLFTIGSTSYTQTPTTGKAIEYTMLYLQDAIIRT